MTALLVAAWVVVGFVIGAKASCTVAWRIALRDDKDAIQMDFWDEPGPFFLLLGCLAAWPLAVIWFTMEWLGALDPPAEVRARKAEKRLAELERELEDTVKVPPHKG